MEKIHKFIECLLPVTSCNLYCSYCYVIQENRRKMEIPTLDYPLETMIKAMTKERFGGICYFSICGAGETLIPEYTLDIVEGLLKNGHYVNITTNGTISKRFDEIVQRFTEEQKTRLHISFSFHFLELKRLGLVEKFFENIHKVANAGCSYFVQINLCDEYMPYLDEIKTICQKETGAFPQVTVTRKETSFPDVKIELRTEQGKEDYWKAGQTFESSLFDFTYKNFMVKRKEFCYAGDWAYVLNLKTGLLKRCYCSCVVQNIFKDIKKPIFKMPVGNYCNEPYCVNSSHFMSLGIIPEIETPSYCDLRNLGGYNEKMQLFLSGKLFETNSACGGMKKVIVHLTGIYDKVAYKAYERVLSIKMKKNSK